MILTSNEAWPEEAAAYHPVIRRAVDYLMEQDLQVLPAGKVDLIPGKMFCLIQEMDSMPFELSRAESHRRFIDVQYLISGHERMGVSRMGNGLRSNVEDRTPGEDILFWQTVRDEIQVTLTPGMFVVFFPHDIHRPCCHPGEGQISHLRKAVIKIDSQLLEDIS